MIGFHNKSNDDFLKLKTYFETSNTKFRPSVYGGSRWLVVGPPPNYGRCRNKLLGFEAHNTRSTMVVTDRQTDARGGRIATLKSRGGRT